VISPIRLLAAGLGAGFSPVAPGTAGSLLAVLLAVPLMLGPWWLLPLAALAASVGGVWLVAHAEGTDDPGWVVIDEVAGQWITLVGLGTGRPALLGLVAGFALFRLLDITKPGPIGWIDRQRGAWPVMADDIAAGLVGAVLLAGLRLALPGWLAG
jgi:phosphatidylglycerophosphatase A